MAQQVIKLKSDVGSKAFRVLDMLTPKNGVVGPAVNADYLGQIHVDTAAKAVYIAIAVGSATPANDWQKMSAAV